MQIQIWFTPASPRSTVFIHAWDQNGAVWDIAGTPAADGVTWGFALSGTTQDQRDISFKYRFANNVWEPDTFTRTVPSLDVTELWTEDYSARCASQAPGPPTTFPTVTINAITEHRFNGGAAFIWVPPNAGTATSESARDDDAETSTFVIQLTPALQSGFHFKLVSAAGVYEPDSAIRFWTPSDGPIIWVKSGDVSVQSTPMTPVQIGVDFFPHSPSGPRTSASKTWSAISMTPSFRTLLRRSTPSSPPCITPSPSTPASSTTSGGPPNRNL